MVNIFEESDFDLADKKYWDINNPKLANEALLVLKNIKEDTELTYNYGYPFDSDFEEHICKCGTKKCVGYILSDDDWPKLKKELKKKK